MAEAMTPTGRFVWHDLMTTDREASLDFYTGLFGWKVDEQDMGPAVGKYSMLKMGDAGVGGVVPLDASCDVPPHWIGYVTVGDLGAVLDKVKQGGGRVPVEGIDVPEVGCFAVVGDPAGGFISPFTPAHEIPEPEGALPAGHFVWNELLTADVERSLEFYTSVFGWQSTPVDMGEIGTYHLLKSDGKDRAGMMQMPPGAQAPQTWLSYIGTDDVDGSATRVKELGGQVHLEPRDIPEVGRFCVCQDSIGALFALFKSAG